MLSRLGYLPRLSSYALSGQKLFGCGNEALPKVGQPLQGRDPQAGIRLDACAPRVAQSRNLRDVWPCHQRRPQVQYQIRAGQGDGAPRRDRCPRVGVDREPDVVRGGDDVKIGDERAALPGAARADRAAER